MSSNLVIGLLSGTSMDGIDVVLVDFSERLPRINATYSHPYPESIRSRLQQLASNTNNDNELSLPRLVKIHNQVAEIFATAVLKLLEQNKTPAEAIACIGFHGQTIAHRPFENPPWTLQLGDPVRLCNLTNIPVISDFRSADMAAGGQGAPLAPLLHQPLFQSGDRQTAVVNIGGIANITQADGSGFDTGPGNCLMDAWIRHNKQLKFDQSGKWAASGQAQNKLIDKWMTDSYFQTTAPKSTGTDYFNLEWVNERCDLDAFKAEDIQASLAELSAISIARSIPESTSSLLVCGGGAHNTYLLQRLQQQLPKVNVDSTASAGVNPDWVEGLLFAWLGWQRIHEVMVDTGKITGASTPILPGVIYKPTG